MNFGIQLKITPQQLRALARRHGFALALVGLLLASLSIAAGFWLQKAHESLLVREASLQEQVRVMSKANHAEQKARERRARFDQMLADYQKHHAKIDLNDERRCDPVYMMEYLSARAAFLALEGSASEAGLSPHYSRFFLQQRGSMHVVSYKCEQETRGRAGL